MLLVLGLTGLASCGKGTVSDYLVKEHGFVKFVFSDILKEEAEKRGLIKNKNYEEQKDIFSRLGDQLRKESGRKGVLAEMLVNKIKSIDAKKVIVDGFRSVEEVKLFRKNFKEFYLIFVDADENMRFMRREIEDPTTTIENFRTRDKRDIEEKGLGKVLEMAEFAIHNDKQSFEYLYEKIDKLLKYFTDSGIAQLHSL
jgi:dephospho-CoA kinase